MIRVLLADDEAIIRAGVRAILATDPGIDVIAEAADGREAVEFALAHRPGVVLLDVRMPRLDGLAAAAELLRVLPGIGVAMLTTFGDDEYVARALDSGARGFLLKSGDPRELLTGIHAIADGGAYLSPDITAQVIGRLRATGLGRAAEARAKVQQLTDRERDVLALVGAGLSNAQIARRLHLVEGTVKGHVSTILARLGLANRVQAAVLAHEAGLVTG
ncbi:two-component system response regulator [Micromonospora sp. ATCC 39149]|uniref:Response regulator transcription factor n=1 Tax=Micromonospora carbonacea TaxID=47853 RepID=A0A7D6CAX9_9ACTN|nr:response regulator transcription factor [Micromonospora sp. ATCC 39149]EEP73581.1 two-component system response regulator [Micromonospora sp. ATCC 39149]QLJ99502.1 response regulator transcription factor [Micromonospora carbonacea]